MIHNRIRIAAMLGLALAGTWSACGISAQETSVTDDLGAPAVLPQYAGDEGGYTQFGLDVFHNYYPNTMTGVNSANMYPTPYPTPPSVGHTYYTYQPLYPHEYLYQHRRVYYNTYGGPEMFYQDPGQMGGAYNNTGYGLNKTTVVWQSGVLSYGPNPIRVLPLQHLRGITGRFGSGVGGCSTCR